MGGVALLGTGTPVHSASGASMVKAVLNAALYRQATLGEAFRDARAYFACLADLKDDRGHKELAKTQRAALSFRLWGDPEIELFPQLLRPRLAPLAAQATAPGLVVVELPEKRLPRVGNEAYQADLLPGSETAGLVSRIKDSSQRRLAGLYFFRLPLPTGFAMQRAGRFQTAGDELPRGFFRLDPLDRFVYVLYFPDQEALQNQVLLKVQPPAREAAAAVAGESPRP